MLLALLAWIYITFICLAWGNMLLRVVAGNTQPVTNGATEWPLICLAGLCVAGGVSMLLCLFIPIALAAHLLIAVPALLYYFFAGNRRRVAAQLALAPYKRAWPFYLLGTVCILLILLISAYRIIHPDTLAYHAQAIHQMELFGTIPGIIHADNKVAISGAWFAMQAVFRFNFIQPHAFLFLNGCVAVWFCIFICLKLAKMQPRQRGEKQPLSVWAWLLLLAFSFASWTQVRLTAASASPDFITALLVWAACYQLTRFPSKQSIFLTVLFSATALSMKLSAIPVLLIPLVCILQQLRRKQWMFACMLVACCIFLIAPFCIRNVLTSGYLFFPSAVPDIFDVDWKADPALLHRLQHYITVYARFPVDDPAAFAQAAQLSFTQWLPRWWQHQYIIDKLLFCTAVALLAFAPFILARQIKQGNKSDLLILITALTGSLLWWLNAPDLRFGTSFLIPLIYVLAKGAADLLPVLKPSITLPFGKIITHVTTVTLLLYTAYRMLYFFNASQLLMPQGVKEVAATPVQCQGVTLYLAHNHNETGFTPPPCLPDSCQYFELRVPGDLRSGFKAKK